LNKIISFFLILISFDLLSQENQIEGVVRDAESKEVLPFTNIRIQNKFRGAIANVEGRYVLDVSNLEPSDSVVFSFVGYKTTAISLSMLRVESEVFLLPEPVNLNAITILSRDLEPKEIIELVKENYEKNHPKPLARQKVFIHTYEHVPFPEDNLIELKKSSFQGLDKATFNDLRKKLPNEFIEYQDAVVNLYSNGEGKQKILPVQAISLEEGSMKDLQKEFELRLDDFIKEMESIESEEGVYLKFRSGIFATKIDDEDNDENSDDDPSNWEEQKKDSLNYLIPAVYVRSRINYLLKGYASLESKNWQFINDPGKYRYELKGVYAVNDEPVYRLDFTPRGRGLFEGTLYISTSTYGILRMSYQYASGKTNENFQLLGVGHSMLNKAAQIIYERRNAAYYVKYIKAEQHETASIDRPFSMKKKQERFLFDKELNEMKFQVNMSFDINSSWELLVMETEGIMQEAFDDIEEPKNVKFKKEYAFSPEMWESTVIAPSGQLSEFKRLTEESEVDNSKL
jgi:hypothetical protein